MMSHTISIRDLHKTYKIYNHPRDMLLEALTSRAFHREHRALSGVNLNVAEGEVVGLLGRNGAGKSTLLRIIAGTLDASQGDITTKGRISAILELGSGFHGDYTGRENVFLGGLCLGLPRDEIKRKFDEIVAFAELEDKIDEPFRTYSSGQKARLTFSVATSVDPDILIIDEALSVGDARFQLKSFDRVRDFKQRGKSILLVSHDINAIVSICDRAVILEGGKVISEGDPKEVGNIYHRLLFQGTLPDTQTREIALPAVDKPATPAADFLEAPVASAYEGMVTLPPASEALITSSLLGGQTGLRYGDGKVRIDSVIVGRESIFPSTLVSRQPAEIRISITALQAVDSFNLGVLLRSSRGTDLYGNDTRTMPCNGLPASLQQGETHVFSLNFSTALAPGEYFLTVGVASPAGTHHDLWFDAAQIVVIPSSSPIYTTSIVDLGMSASAHVLTSKNEKNS